ncbi:hypothetical protein JKP88DRAFT_268317 [Tribonema minus]|uniref:Uncharacterized protein n=1 Tax=Tribonema minus TaxID=303371 RepID=A0A835Z4H6_9STRA|nr:hypothetical protein JKP88DRAFT_268317 [Tribonema minus]
MVLSHSGILPACFVLRIRLSAPSLVAFGGGVVRQARALRPARGQADPLRAAQRRRQQPVCGHASAEGVQCDKPARFGLRCAGASVRAAGCTRTTTQSTSHSLCATMSPPRACSATIRSRPDPLIAPHALGGDMVEHRLREVDCVVILVTRSYWIGTWNYVLKQITVLGYSTWHGACFVPARSLRVWRKKKEKTAERQRRSAIQAGAKLLSTLMKALSAPNPMLLCGTRQQQPYPCHRGSHCRRSSSCGKRTRVCGRSQGGNGGDKSSRTRGGHERRRRCRRRCHRTGSGSNRGSSGGGQLLHC